MMYLDGEEFEVEPGHVIVNRPGGTHGLKNIGNSELKLVVVEVPVY
jgi:mannose-6-phosphate isomerase-like protein (cupin superfamily)